jgi:hypothetical protein
VRFCENHDFALGIGARARAERETRWRSRTQEEWQTERGSPGNGGGLEIPRLTENTDAQRTQERSDREPPNGDGGTESPQTQQTRRTGTGRRVEFQVEFS